MKENKRFESKFKKGIFILNFALFGMFFVVSAVDAANPNEYFSEFDRPEEILAKISGFLPEKVSGISADFISDNFSDADQESAEKDIQDKKIQARYLRAQVFEFFRPLVNILTEAGKETSIILSGLSGQSVGPAVTGDSVIPKVEVRAEEIAVSISEIIGRAGDIFNQDFLTPRERIVFVPQVSAPILTDEQKVILRNFVSALGSLDLSSLFSSSELAVIENKITADQIDEELINLLVARISDKLPQVQQILRETRTVRETQTKETQVVLNDQKLVELQNFLAALQKKQESDRTSLFNAIALTNKIDKIENVTIVNPTFQSGAITDSDIPDTITASNYLPLGGGLLTGALNASSTLQVTGATTIYGDLTIGGLVITSGGSLTGGGTTTVSNLIVTNLSTSTFSGALTVQTDKLVVDKNTGNVGIGSTTPGAKLSIAGKSLFDGLATFYNALFGNITATGTLNVSGLSTLGNASTTQISSSGSTYLATSGGNVGVGTTSPVQQLGVAGLIYVGGAGTSTFENNVQVRGQLKVGTSSTYISGSEINATENFTLRTQSDQNHLVLQTLGRVGVSSSTPWGVFSVDKNGASASMPIVVVSEQGSANPFLLIDYLGKIGIGTTSPSRLFSVQGNGLFSGDLAVANITATGTFTTSGLFSFGNASGTQLTTTGSAYLATTVGNVGVGSTTPGAKLSVSGTSLFDGLATFYNALFGNITATGTVTAANLSASGSTTLQNFTANNSTSTQATTTYLAITGAATATQITVSNSSFFNGLSNFLSGMISSASSTFASTLKVTGAINASSTLQVTGNSRLYGTLTTDGAATLSSTLNVTGLATLGYASTTQISSIGSSYFATSGGNVGIGTTSPVEQLSVANRLYVGGTGTSTIENNLKVQGTFQVGTSSTYITNDSVSGASGIFSSSLRSPSFASLAGDGTSLTLSTNNVVAQVTAGSVNITAGNGYSALNGSNAGSVNITAGTNSAAGNSGGSMVLNGATGGGTYNGGAITINGGIGANSPNRTGGAITLTAGQNNGTMTGASLTLNGGFSTDGTGNGVGGSVTLSAGNGNTNDTTAPPANITIKGGTRTNGTGGGGNILLVPDGSGTQTGKVGIGTSTPWGSLSIELNSTISNAATPLFVIGDSGTTSPYVYVSGVNGFFGLGTTSPSRLFAVQGSGLFSGDLSVANLTATGTFTTAGLFSFGNASGTQLTTTGSTYLATSGGNVGVGTANPAARVDIQSDSGTLLRAGNSSFADLLEIPSSTSGEAAIRQPLLVRPHSPSGTYGALDVGNNNSDPTAPIARFRYDSDAFLVYGNRINALGNAIIDGSVGIGTSTPSQKLAVHGNALFSGNISSANMTATGTLSLTGTSGTSTIASGQGFAIGTSQFVVQQTTGNIGIGTATPKDQLSIGNRGTIHSASGIGTLLMNNLYYDGTDYRNIATGGGSNIRQTGGVIFFQNSPSGTADAVETVSERMRLDTAGNLGIGTTTPPQRLAIHGNTLISGDLSAANISATGTLNVSGLTTLGNASTTQISSTGSTYLATTGGNVGIGIATFNTGAKFIVNETAADREGLHVALNGSARGKLGINTSSGGIFTLRDNVLNTDVVLDVDANSYYNGSGNFGIGTTSPSRLFAVQGSGLFSGDLSVANLTATGTFTTSGLFTFGNASGTQLTTTGSTYLATAGGTVGIGTNSPLASNGSIFDVKQGTNRHLLVDYWTAGNMIQLESVNDAFGANVPMNIQANPLILNGPTGNVGIGTSSPKYVFDVQNSGDGSSLATSAFFHTNDSASSGLFLANSSSVSRIMSNNYTGTGGTMDLQLSTGLANGTGVDVMRLTSTGNIGIGTTSPVARLEVVSSGVSGPRLRLSNSNGTSANNEITFQSATTTVGQIYTDSSGNGGQNFNLQASGASGLFRFLTGSGAGTEVARITTAGNIGIGTTTPGAQLQVYKSAGQSSLLIGGANVSSDYSTIEMRGNDIQNNWLISSSYLTGSALQFTPSTAVAGSTYATPAMTLAASGNVGIGTNNPGKMLEVAGDVAMLSNASNPKLWMGDSLSAGDFGFLTWRSSTDSLVLGSSTGGDALTILESNNIGIGTTTPNSRLSVSRAASSASYPSNASAIFEFGGSNHVVSIAGDSSYQLGLAFSNPTNAYDGLVAYNSDRSMQFNTAASERMRITSAGNVGIGTTSPITKLDVASSINGEAGMLVTNSNTGSSAYTQLSVAESREANRHMGLIYLPSTYSNSSVANSGAIVTGSGATNGFYIQTGAAAPIRFVPNSTEAMRITSGGQVFVGTTTQPNYADTMAIVNSANAIEDGSGGAALGLYSTFSDATVGRGGILALGGKTQGFVNPVMSFATIAGFRESATPTNNSGYLALSTAPNGGLPVERMRINSTGNVGIGTVSPNLGSYTGKVLTLNGSGASPYNAVFELGMDSQGSGDATIGVWDNGAGAANTIAQIKVAGANDKTGAFRFLTSTSGGALTEAMRITGTQNVGIGTTTPSALLNLASAAPTLRFSDTEASHRDAQIRVDSSQFVIDDVESSTLPQHAFGLNSGNSYLQRQGGNLGIGTTSPVTKLDVYAGSGQLEGVNVTGSDNPVFALISTGATPQQIAMRLVPSDGSFRITDYTGLDGAPSHVADFLTINTSGNVGIGTTSPVQQLSVANRLYVGGTGTSTIENNLHVRGTLQVGTGSVYLTDAGLTTTNGTFNLTNAATSTFGTSGFAVGTSQLVVQQTSGRVGIGTTAPGSPSATGLNFDTTSQLHVNGSIGREIISGTTLAGLMLIDTDGASHDKAVELRNSDQNLSFVRVNDDGNIEGTTMYLANSGNVGIGTTSPAATLHLEASVPRAIYSKASSDLRSDIYIGGGFSSFEGQTSRFQIRADLEGSAKLPLSLSGKGIEFASAGDQGTVVKMVLNSSGNVGIGTASPTQGPLVISRSSDGFVNTATLINPSSGTSAVNRIQLGTDASDGSGQILVYGSQHSSKPNYMEVLNANNAPLSLGSNNSVAMTILGGGNVGIGTTTPKAKTQIDSAKNTTGLILNMTNPSALNDYTALDFTRYDTGNVNARVAALLGSADTSGELALYTNPGPAGASPLERVRVNYAGNVGIGTTTPDGILNTLSAGPVRFDDSTTDDNNILVLNQRNGYSAGSRNMISFSQGVTPGTNMRIGYDYDTQSFQVRSSTDAARFIVLNSGNVGIGTTTPTEQLSVANRLYVGGTGTSTIENNLHVRGTLQVGTGSVYLTNAGITTTNGTFNLTNSATSTFGTSGFTVGTSQLVVQQTSGNVGIGTSAPKAPLDTQSNSGGTAIFIRGRNNGGVDESSIQFRNYSDSADHGYINGLSGRLDLYGGSTNTMTLKAGNVGIGTTSPSQTLAVQGNALFSGNISSVTNITATGTLSLTGTSGTTTIASGQGFTIGSSQFVLQQGSGRVGIGTATPAPLAGASGKLFVSGTGDTSILVQGGTGGAIETGLRSILLQGQVGTYTDHDFNVVQNGNPYITVRSGGNVGIGTTTPTDKLTIAGATPGLQFTDTAQTSPAGLYTFKDTSDQIILYRGVPGSQTAKAAFDLNGLITGNALAVDNTSAGNFTGTHLTSFPASGNSFINNGGNVGIGTTSPVSKLQITDSNKTLTNATQNVLVYTSDAQAADIGGAIGFGGLYNASDNTTWASIAGRKENGTSGNFAGYLQLNTRANGSNPAEAMRITSAGNIGIGTTTPDEKLNVYGAIRSLSNAANWSSSNGAVMDWYPAGSQARFVAAVNGSNSSSMSFNVYNSGASQQAMTIINTGNVGIGTTTPSSTLTVRSGSNASMFVDADDGAYASIGLSKAGATQWYFTKAPSRTDLSLFNGSSQEKLTVNQSGNVGVGTTSPAWTLDVNGSTAVAARLTGSNGTQLRFNEPAAGEVFAIGTGVSGGASSAGNAAFEIYDLAHSASRIFVKGDGNVGIGTTTPSAKLNINKNHNYLVNGWDDAAHLNLGGETNGSKRLQLGVDTTNNFGWLRAVNVGSTFYPIAIAPDGGNVGIGTTTPVEKLEVNGDIFSSGQTGANASDASIYTQANNTGQTQRIMVDNTNNTNAGSNASLFISTGGASAGDSTVQFNNRVQNWIMGLDNSDSDKFKIAYSTALGTDDKFTIDSGGNVGIGTSTPSSSLQVRGTADQTPNGAGVHLGMNATDNIAVAEFNGSSGTNIDFSNTPGEDYDFRIEHSASNALFSITPNSASGIYMNSLGNVGIGTTSPVSNLEVAGTDTVLRVSGQSAANAAILRLSTGGVNRWDVAVNDNLASTGGTLEFSQSGATPKMVILSGGNIGIGTTTPDAVLSAVGFGIKVHDSAGSGSGRMTIGNNTINNGSSYINMIGSNSVTNWQIATNGADSGAFEIVPSTVAGGSTFTTPAFAINSAGNVGIGMNNSQRNLEIRGATMAITHASADQNANLFFGKSDGTDGWSIGQGVTANDGDFKIYDNQAGAVQMIMKQGGNVGIGTTTPTTKFAVHGNALFSGNLSVAGVTATGTVSVGGIVTIATTASAADSGGAGRATYNSLDTASSNVYFTCNDTNGGCQINFTETNVTDGQLLTITNVSANPSYVSDSAGVVELYSGNEVTLNQYETVTLKYASDRWVEVARLGGGTGSGTVNTGLTGQFPYYAADGTAVSATSTLFVSTGSNIGIGTTTPTYKLTVAGKTAAFNSAADGSLSAWSTNPSSLPGVRDGQAAVSANGYAYVIGGRDAAGVKDTAYFAKLNSNGTIGSWSTSTYSLPATLQNLASVSANGYIYAIGGKTADAGGSAVATVYYAKINSDGSIGRWNTNSNSLPAARAGLTALAVNGYIYAFGGQSTAGTSQGNTYYAKLNSDGSTGSWSSATSMPAGIAHHASVVANGYVYIIGGYTSLAVSTVYYAPLNNDGTLGSWSPNSNSLPAARMYISSAVANGYVYVIGGFDGSFSQSTIYYAKLNANGSIDSWSTDTNNPLPSILYSGKVVTANGYIYTLGGNNGTNRISTIYYSSTARVSMLANLDLIGLASTTLSDANSSDFGSVGGSIFAGNIFSAGRLEVTGGASLWNGLNVNGALSLHASSTPGSPVFTITSATGTPSTISSVFSVSSTGSTTASSLTLNNNFDSGSTTPAANTLYKENIVKGWVNFDGVVATPTIRDAFNVSSITDNGTGDYTTNWTNGFANAYYAVSGSCEHTGGNRLYLGVVAGGLTSSSVRTICNNSASTADSTVVSVMAIGDQ